MKRASAILSTVGYIILLVLLPLFAILAVVFGLLGNSNSVFADFNGFPLGYFLTGFFSTLGVFALAGLILTLWARARVLNAPNDRNGYIGLIVAGGLTGLPPLLLAGIFGLCSLNSGDGKSPSEK